MKIIFNLFLLLFILSIVFTLVGWSVDGFDFFKFQDNKHYFQSWISIAGVIFTFIMSITTFIIYKKSDLSSLKFISLSFFLTSLAYGIIGYHASYCKVCSDLSMCSASHNYPNYFIVIALIIFVVSVLLANIKHNIKYLKLLSFGLIFATMLLMIVLFISIKYMETPDIITYVFTTLNLQGYIFIFPLIFILFATIYFRTIYKLTSLTNLIFSLLFISFIPQAIHVFSCDECHIMECSEFYVLAGLLMFISTGLLIYSLSLAIEKKV